MFAQFIPGFYIRQANTNSLHNITICHLHHLNEFFTVMINALLEAGEEKVFSFSSLFRKKVLSFQASEIYCPC